MSSKSKSAIVISAAGTRAAKAPGRRGRGAAVAPEGWAQIALDLDERDYEIDCLRIVLGDRGRSLPLYYDDCN